MFTKSHTLLHDLLFNFISITFSLAVYYIFVYNLFDLYSSRAHTLACSLSFCLFQISTCLLHFLLFVLDFTCLCHMMVLSGVVGRLDNTPQHGDLRGRELRREPADDVPVAVDQRHLGLLLAWKRTHHRLHPAFL